MRAVLEFFELFQESGLDCILPKKRTFDDNWSSFYRPDAPLVGNSAVNKAVMGAQSTESNLKKITNWLIISGSTNSIWNVMTLLLVCHLFSVSTHCQWHYSVEILHCHIRISSMIVVMLVLGLLLTLSNLLAPINGIRRGVFL